LVRRDRLAARIGVVTPNDQISSLLLS